MMDRKVARAVAEVVGDIRSGRFPNSGAIHRAIWDGAYERVLMSWDDGDKADDAGTLRYVRAQYEAVAIVRNWSAGSVDVWIAAALDVLRAHGMYSAPVCWPDRGGLNPFPGCIGPGYVRK